MKLIKLNILKQKILLLSLFVLTFISIQGCTQAQQNYSIQVGMLSTEASVLKDQYAVIEKLLRTAQSERHMFTDDEYRRLLNVDASIDMVIQRYTALTHLNTTNINLSDVEFMWNLAASSYIDGRSVIKNHWDESEPSTQVLLNGFDRKASITSKRMDELLNDPSNANINQALVLVSGVLTIAIKMLSIAAVL